MAFYDNINISETLKAWRGFSIGKILISAITFCVCVTVYNCQEEFKQVMDIYIKKLDTNVVTATYDPASGVPTSVRAQDKEAIRNNLRIFLSNNPDAIGIIVYEFVPKGNEMLYQGRSIVASESQSGTIVTGKQIGRAHV